MRCLNSKVNPSSVPNLNSEMVIQHDSLVRCEVADHQISIGYVYWIFDESFRLIKGDEFTEPSPRCHWNTSVDWIMEGDDVLMTCNVSYTSNSSLVIQWNGFNNRTSSCSDTQHAFMRTCSVSFVIHSLNLSSFRSSCSVTVMFSDNKTAIHQSRCVYERNISIHCK